MGILIDKTDFTNEDYEAFARKLRTNLEALRELLKRPEFGRGRATFGAELELFLIDKNGGPLPLNREVLAESGRRLLTVELSRYSLELGFDPLPFVGKPFAAWEKQMQTELDAVREAASRLGGRIVPIGILPSLERDHLGSWALTDLSRYRALSASTQRLKQAPFHLRIEGEDILDTALDDVTAEGANTSLQAHLRVEPSQFATLYNAAQIATGPVLAACGNSPFFLGKRLWEETRIALFRQAIDDRPTGDAEAWRPARVSFGHGWVREGAWELFAENVGLHAPLLPVVTDEDPLTSVRAGKIPELEELRLHHGTVWRWNRAVYDPTAGGHLRIEFRALPAGPTVLDMSANAAFLLGLTLSIAPQLEWYQQRLTFGHARRNFYCAARQGLEGELLWPLSSPPSPKSISARELLPRLIDQAHAGLLTHGIAREEADRLLGVIRARVDSGRTGSRWLRNAHRNLGSWKRLVERYHQHSVGGCPVHEWPSD